MVVRLYAGIHAAPTCAGVRSITWEIPIQPATVNILSFIDYLFVFVEAVFVALRSEEPDLIS